MKRKSSRRKHVPTSPAAKALSFAALGSSALMLLMGVPAAVGCGLWIAFILALLIRGARLGSQERTFTNISLLCMILSTFIPIRLVNRSALLAKGETFWGLMLSFAAVLLILMLLGELRYHPEAQEDEQESTGKQTSKVIVSLILAIMLAWMMVESTNICWDFSAPACATGVVTALERHTSRGNVRHEIDVGYDGQTLNFCVSQNEWKSLREGSLVALMKRDGFWGMPWVAPDFPAD